MHNKPHASLFDHCIGFNVEQSNRLLYSAVESRRLNLGEGQVTTLVKSALSLKKTLIVRDRDEIVAERNKSEQWGWGHDVLEQI